MSSAPVTLGLSAPFGYGAEFSDLVSVAAPSAGANKAVGVPGDYSLRIIGALATLSTDANAANRLLSLDYINAGGVTFYRNAAAKVFAANTSGQTFVWGSNRTVSEWAAGTPQFVPVLPFFLDPGCSVQFTIDAKQAGDTLTALFLLVEKWPTGTRGELRGTVQE